ncbi:MAG: hypothetical protein KatS3mg131_1771 [Candidatus Tectimicrobiota bacterium]|nr:MAG: hypothetical protein KatS3mg131_1771 [Candidatus Tectomicrobia bacterium]
MAEPRLALAEVLRQLPPPWPEDPQPAIRAALEARAEKVVVLDDDPTGTQTVHGVPVLTAWPVAALAAELANSLPAVYLLTNSRSLPLAAAQACNAEIGRALCQAARQTGRRFVVVSRSDSTLRGHFPGEVEALAAALETPFDAWLLVPFFEEGGRYTLGDVHYVAEGETLVPAAATEFARDAAFGYRTSHLPRWVEEKTGGRIPAAAVASVSLEDLRRGGPSQVTARLLALAGGRVCVVNALCRRDLEVFVQGLLAAEAQGKRFLYRTAASFVPVRAGIPPQALLPPAALTAAGGHGSLTLVGSHVPRTTSQLAQLLAEPGVVALELPVAALLSERERDRVVADTARQVNVALRRGADVVVFTSREVVTGREAADSLAIAQRVSAGLVAVVQALDVRPRYLLAKGGITASDIATRGLGVRRAMVLGQILPGVPVWQLGEETRFPGLAYVVFPGNVGGPEALRTLVAACRLPAGE